MLDLRHADMTDGEIAARAKEALGHLADDGEPKPNSPEDAGYLTPEQLRAERARTHRTQECRSCGGAIYWALTENGKRMPVDAAESPDGNCVLFDRHGSVMVRVLRAGEAPRPGEKRRLPHWKTCPNADQHRRSR